MGLASPGTAGPLEVISLSTTVRCWNCNPSDSAPDQHSPLYTCKFDALTSGVAELLDH
jgi:hypothetical protein